MEIVVKKGLRIRKAVPAQEFEKSITAEMVNNSGREIDLATVVAGKSVALNEPARKTFRGSEAVGFAHERGVQIHTDQFDALRWQRGACGKPADYVANATANVDDSQRAAKAIRANR